jgi:Sulfotransferase family
VVSTPLRFLTVVTYGRSGSTTLQSALNAHPHVLIRGENYNAFTGMWRYWQSIQDSGDRHHSGKADHPWFGTARLNPDAILADLHEHAITHILRPKSVTQWVGFKEVRYERAYFPDSSTLLSYLLFLQELLPGLAFLFNTRDPRLAVKSGWWSKNPEALHVLEDTHANLLRTSRELEILIGTHRVQVLNHDLWKNDPANVVRALRTLTFPVEEGLIRESLATQLMHGQNRHRSGSELS